MASFNSLDCCGWLQTLKQKIVLPNFHQHVSCPPEETKLWTMYTQTWLMPTTLSPSPTQDNLTTSHCSYCLSTPHSSDMWNPQCGQNRQIVARGSKLCTSADIDLYASSVLDCINSNINSVTTLKRIITLPNQKPCMNTWHCLQIRQCSGPYLIQG